MHTDIKCNFFALAVVQGLCCLPATPRSSTVPRPQRCLTLRSSGAPTAGHQRPVGGTQYIFTVRALASCRRRPLNSNVRAQNSPFCPSPRPNTQRLSKQASDNCQTARSAILNCSRKVLMDRSRSTAASDAAASNLPKQTGLCSKLSFRSTTVGGQSSATQ